MKKEVEFYLNNLWGRIGIDRPANHDEILQFIQEDVEETADPVHYHSGDMDIAFRRYLEKDYDQ